MFQRNSAFTPTSGQQEALESVRRQALETKVSDPTPKGQDRLAYVAYLMEGAESAMADEDYAEVVRLVSQARDELAHGPDLGS